MYSAKPKLRQRQRKYKPGNLKTIAIDVTQKCNMNCSHCYAHTFIHADPIPLNILKKTMDEAYKIGVFHYVLAGGEPTEDPERLESIISMCYPDETYINVISNGWNMSKDKILWLKNLKVDKICLSMDSGIPEEHDSNRRHGSYDRVLEAIDNILEAGLLASISIVVTHHSLYSKGFQNTYNLAKDKKIRLDVQIAEPVGKWDGQIDNLITTNDSNYIKSLEINSPILPNGQKMIKRDIYIEPADHCPAGTEFLIITVDGNILPCNFLHFSLGNIKDKTIKEVRNDLIANIWFNGKQPNCICGENPEFINKFIVPHINKPKPLDAYKLFNLKEKINNERI